jgi:hypothetical protein
MGHGVNIVTLSEETERNREYKATPKVSKAHIYSTEIYFPGTANTQLLWRRLSL